ncbi:MAG TPA: hypothetical protein DDZ51_04300 [Planctomycetaceae bacterium]|nr:hypothetical protein [Planctomycetaceae bacterium]
MFCRYMFVDDVHRPPPSKVPDAGKVFDPSWDQIEAALSRLDGMNIRAVILSETAPDDSTGWPVGGKGLIIGGGGDKLYICKFVTEGDDHVMYLTQEEYANSDPQEIMCGQPITVDGELTIDLDTLLRATYKFATTGERTGHWKEMDE